MESPQALIKLLVDTGAPVNAIDELTYRNLAESIQIEPCNTRFFGYSAKTPLAVLEQFTTYWVTKITRAGFIIVKIYERCLNSFKTSIDLGIIAIDTPETPIAKLFEAKQINAMAGESPSTATKRKIRMHTLEIDKNAKPVR